MKQLYQTTIALIGVTGFIVLSILVTIGWAYWIWMAIMFQSFGMFVFGILGPLGFFAALIGLWSLFIGAPAWLVHLVT